MMTQTIRTQLLSSKTNLMAGKRLQKHKMGIYGRCHKEKKISQSKNLNAELHLTNSRFVVYSTFWFSDDFRLLCTWIYCTRAGVFRKQPLYLSEVVVGVCTLYPLQTSLVGFHQVCYCCCWFLDELLVRSAESVILGQIYVFFPQAYQFAQILLFFFPFYLLPLIRKVSKSF